MDQMYDFSVLRELRKRGGLTLRDVSEQSGVSAAVLSRLERNQSMAELPTLYRLARVFDLTAADLLHLTENRSAQAQQETAHTSHGFSFREMRYGNVRALFGHAPGGATMSRPEIHKDDYEVCWVLSGSLRLCLPNQRCDLADGEAVQFDAILSHTYEALSDCSLIILHMTKQKRF